MCGPTNEKLIAAGSITGAACWRARAPPTPTAAWVTRAPPRSRRSCRTTPLSSGTPKSPRLWPRPVCHQLASGLASESELESRYTANFSGRVFGERGRSSCPARSSTSAPRTTTTEHEDTVKLVTAAYQRHHQENPL